MIFGVYDVVGCLVVCDYGCLLLYEKGGVEFFKSSVML